MMSPPQSSSGTPGKTSKKDPVSGPAEGVAPAAGVVGEKKVVGSGEFRSSADRRTGLVSGIKAFDVKRVTYSNVNGIGIFEGDIALGTVEKLEKTKAAADTVGLPPTLAASGRGRTAANVQFSIAITG
ncbi:MAG: hypothetical protein ACREX8_15925, partial [Gammaproteobacteria bacterium]